MARISVRSGSLCFCARIASKRPIFVRDVPAEEDRLALLAQLAPLGSRQGDGATAIHVSALTHEGDQPLLPVSEQRQTTVVDLSAVR
jgi:hypothetical protein